MAIFDPNVLPYDFSLDPFVPHSGFSVVEHVRDGQGKMWRHPSRIKLRKLVLDTEGRTVGGIIRSEGMNANLLDAFLVNPSRITNNWRCVLFTGTVYRRPNGTNGMRCLCRWGDGWTWTFYTVGGSWHTDLTLLQMRHLVSV